MVYVTAPATSTSAKTKNITSACYYYFDGAQWQAAKGNGCAANINANNGLTVKSDTVQLGGALIQNTEIAQNGKDFYTSGAGKVSIGAAPTASSSKFEVNGASTNTSSFAAIGRDIDFTQSNLAYSVQSAGQFNMTGLKDGGTYTLAVKGVNSGTSSFSFFITLITDQQPQASILYIRLL